MRPIKFRAWDIRCKHFIYYDIKNRGAFCIALDGGSGYEWTIKGGGGIQWWDKDRFILQQFIGLIDQHGKEIYEGDIVRCIVDNEFLYTQEIKYTTERFTNGEYGYPMGIGFKVNWNEGDGPEIIGNICESPELLKGEK